jgi:hypothetical protein
MASISILSSAVNKVGGLGCLTAAVLLALAGAVTAQTAPPAATPAATPAAAPAGAKPAAPAPTVLVKPAWASLSPAQKLALEPLAGEWDRMESLRKQKWLEIANRFASMKPDEQARMHEKMREWVRMTPDERRLVRENYTKAKKLDVTQKSEQWEKYQQLPEEQKQKLAAEAAAKAKKPLTNLPSPNQPNAKTSTPIKKPAPACPPGSVSNPALHAPAAPGAALPACVAVAASGTAQATAPASTSAAGSAAAPAAAAPAAVPVNAK